MDLKIDPPPSDIQDSVVNGVHIKMTNKSTRGLGGVVGLTLPMARADRGSHPVYYRPCSDLGQIVNLSLSVA